MAIVLLENRREPTLGTHPAVGIAGKNTQRNTCSAWLVERNQVHTSDSAFNVSVSINQLHKSQDWGVASFGFYWHGSGSDLVSCPDSPHAPNCRSESRSFGATAPMSPLRGCMPAELFWVPCSATSNFPPSYSFVKGCKIVLQLGLLRCISLPQNLAKVPTAQAARRDIP